MNPRSAPFQFMSIDPAKRQAELEKRFGLPKPSEKKMHLDLGNPGFTGMRKESSSASNSPRLQHRVPMFMEGMDEPAQSTVDGNPTNVDAGQKPRVRVVPIEVETADSTKKRARAFSGDPYSRGHGLNNMRSRDPWFDAYEPKQDEMPSMGGPRVCNIPIKVERASPNSKSRCAAQKAPVKKEPEVKTIPVQKEETPKPTLVNGCNSSKQSRQPPKQESPLPHETSLKKIAVVLDKLQGYQAEVEKFSGTSKEKQYRYLDEMLTRLMLDLDNVETMGNEDVRLKRKDAIKKVQHCVDMLESKVCDSNQASSNQDVPHEMSVEACSEEAVPTEVPEVDEEAKDSDVPILPEVEMKEVDQPELPNDAEKQPGVVEADQTMEAETQASQLEVNEGTASPKKEEGTEVEQDIEISEVVEGDINPQEVITTEPIVSDTNGSCETVVNSTGEHAVERSDVQISEVTADSKQPMEIDDVENEKTLDETVKELDHCVSVKSVSDNIPNTEMDNHSVENTSSEIESECNLSSMNS